MSSNFLLCIGYLCFGLLTGYLTGISDGEISKVILTALFALFGGKLFIEILKKEEKERTRAGVVLVAFSLAFLASFNIGIYIKVHRLFTPEDYRNETLKKDANQGNPYTRGFTAPIDTTENKSP